jgi:chemotaxis protein CheY-P-specific phosphatase CheC
MSLGYKMTDKNDVLTEVMIDVLEKLAFMFGDEVGKEEIPFPGRDCVEANMYFKGPRSGKLGIVVPVDICPVIAANILGMDVEDLSSQDQDFDALKEVLNVICGNVLTTLEGDEAVFDLTVPETQFVSAQKWNEILNSSESIAYIVDEQPALMYFRFDE